MAGEPQIVVVGNMAGDPQLRWTASGHAVASFTIAQTPRSFNRESNQWVDDETLWVRCTVWREQAEWVAESLTKGMRVIAHGRLNARSFETKSGEQRTNWELTVDEIGPSLRWATAQVTRRQSQGAQPQQGGYSHGGQPQMHPNWTGNPQSAVPPTAGGGWGDQSQTSVWAGGGQQQQGAAPPF